MNEPVKFRITEEAAPDGSAVICLEAKTGLKIAARIEMGLEDYAKAINGHEILAHFSQGAG